MLSIIFKFVWFSIKMLAVIVFIFFCGLCSMSLAIGARLSGGSSNQSLDMLESYGQEEIAKLMFAGSTPRQTQGYHSGVDSADGWNYGGYDWTTSCNDIIYSPLPGYGVVSYNGTDGYVGPYATNGEENSELRIKGDWGEVRVLHGIYTVPPGTEVLGGVTPIGKNASVGNSSGCHAHITFKQDPGWTPPKTIFSGSVQHTGSKGNYGSVLTDYSNVQLRISHYEPSLGGTNCDHDCTTMASGDKVASWALGKNGVYAAACPQEWPYGTQFKLDSTVYECRDHGGWINCYQNGDFDPTLGGHTAQGNYCWVDILGKVPYPYGFKTSEWSFVK